MILILIVAVAAFVSGVLVGLKNAKVVNSVVDTTNTVVTDIKTATK